jgi:O-antigen ligase
MSQAMSVRLAARVFDPAQMVRTADWLAIAVAASIPWSTSATGVLVAIWLVALLPTIRLAEVRCELADPAGGLPVLLGALMLVGVLWADATLTDRMTGLKGYPKLLLIPLFMLQFRRSARGTWVLGAFLASCTALLVLSWGLHAIGLVVPGAIVPGVPVKSYIAQNTEFVISAFAAGHLAVAAWRSQRRMLALAFALLAVAFIANVAFVVTARNALAIIPALLLLLALQCFGWKGTLSVAVLGVVFAGIVWASSPHLRMRALGVLEEVQQYRQENAETSSGYRLAFWKSSLAFIAAAPIIGHGVGSIGPLFRQATAGQSGAAGTLTTNAHNQTLEIAIQTGLAGVSVLYALWIAQVLKFWRGGLTAWLGMGLVVQAIIGSLVLSFVTDFSTGWIYVLGVGVLGGMIERERDMAAGPAHEGSQVRRGGE